VEPPPDHFRHNRQAAADRYVKAQAIAAWCWGHGVTPEHLMALTEQERQALARRAVEKPASQETQHLAFCMLEVKVAWAAAHPDDPAARRPEPMTLDAVTAALARRRTR
jgi:hypothetical protein